MLMMKLVEPTEVKEEIRQEVAEFNHISKRMDELAELGLWESYDILEKRSWQIMNKFDILGVNYRLEQVC
jgi:hypothetical protein